LRGKENENTQYEKTSAKKNEEKKMKQYTFKRKLPKNMWGIAPIHKLDDAQSIRRIFEFSDPPSTIGDIRQSQRMYRQYYNIVKKYPKTERIIGDDPLYYYD